MPSRRVPQSVTGGTGGNMDLINGTWTPNANHTGSYMVLPQETLVNRFINKMPLLGDDNREALSPEPVLIPSPYIIRFMVHNASPTETLRLVLTLGLYRKATF